MENESSGATTIGKTILKKVPLGVCALPSLAPQVGPLGPLSRACLDIGGRLADKQELADFGRAESFLSQGDADRAREIAEVHIRERQVLDDWALAELTAYPQVLDWLDLLRRADAVPLDVVNSVLEAYGMTGPAQDADDIDRLLARRESFLEAWTPLLKHREGPLGDDLQAQTEGALESLGGVHVAFLRDALELALTHNDR